MTQATEPISAPDSVPRQWWIRLGFWALLLLSAVGLFQVHGWKREQDLSRYLPGNFQETWQKFQAVNRDFGFDRGLLFALEAPSGQDVFAPAMVRLNRTLTQRLRSMPGIQRVVSLANSVSLSKQGETMVVRPLFPRDLKKYGAPQQKKLRQTVLKDPLLRGSLVSANGRATFVIAFLKPTVKPAVKGSAASSAGAEPTVKKALALHKELSAQAPKARWGVVGQPFVGPLLEKHLRPQILLTVGLFALWTVLMFLFFIPGWRRKGWFFGVSVPALFLGLSSHMGWHSGLHLSIHLIPLWIWWVLGLWAMYASAPAEDIPSSSWLWMGTVMLLVWSVALAFHPWPMFQRWGLTTAFTLVAVLALVRLFAPPPRPVTWKRQTPLTWSALTKSTSVLLILFLGAGLGWLPWGISSLQHTYPLHGLLARGEQISQQHFGGSVPFFIRFQGDLQDPVHLKAMERVGNRLTLLPGVAPVQSYGVIVRQLHAMLNQVPRIPDSRLKISSLAILLEGQPALASLIRQNNHDGIIQGRINLTDPWRQRALLSEFQRALRDVPLRHQAVSWAKASPQLREQLLIRRVTWVGEGVTLWLQRYTSHTLTAAQQQHVHKLLHSYLLQLHQPTQRFVLEQTRLSKELARYLNSEDCDLELKQAQKQKVVLALFRLNLQGKMLQKGAIQAALVQALQGTEAGKDRKSIGYAVRSLSSIARRLRQDQQLMLLQQRLFQLFRMIPRWTQQASVRLRAGGSQAARTRIALLRGELLELHNPHWYRTDQGPQQLRVQHTGLHKLLISLATETIHQSSRAVWILFLVSFLTCWVMLRSLSAAWWVWFPIPITWFATLGLLGWQDIPLDLTVVFCLLFLSGFAIFPSLYLYHIQNNPSPAKNFLSHRQFLSRMAMWISLPATTLLWTSLPPLQHIGLLLTIGPWLALLACLACHPGQEPE